MRRTVLLVAVVSLLGGCSASAPSATAVQTAPPPVVGDPVTTDTRAASEPPSAPVPVTPIVVLVAGDGGDPAGLDPLVAALRALPAVTVQVAEPGIDLATALDSAPEPPDVVVVGTGGGPTVGPFVTQSPLVAAAFTAAQRGLPSIAVSAGGNQSSDFTVAARLAAEEVDGHRAEYGSGTNVAQMVVNLNTPSCAPGTMVRGVVEVPVAGAPTLSGSPADPAVSDCGSTMIEYTDDASALAIGFASRSLVSG